VNKFVTQTYADAQKTK